MYFRMLLKALRRKKKFGPGQREIVNIWITTKLIPWSRFSRIKEWKNAIKLSRYLQHVFSIPFYAI